MGPSPSAVIPSDPTRCSPRCPRRRWLRRVRSARLSAAPRGWRRPRPRRRSRDDAGCSSTSGPHPSLPLPARDGRGVATLVGARTGREARAIRLPAPVRRRERPATPGRPRAWSRPARHEVRRNCASRTRRNVISGPSCARVAMRASMLRSILFPHVYAPSRDPTTPLMTFVSVDASMAGRARPLPRSTRSPAPAALRAAGSPHSSARSARSVAIASPSLSAASRAAAPCLPAELTMMPSIRLGARSRQMLPASRRPRGRAGCARVVHVVAAAGYCEPIERCDRGARERGGER